MDFASEYTYRYDVLRWLYRVFGVGWRRRASGIGVVFGNVAGGGVTCGGRVELLVQFGNAFLVSS